jgi:hypothetical protein
MPGRPLALTKPSGGVDERSETALGSLRLLDTKTAMSWSETAKWVVAFLAVVSVSELIALLRYSQRLSREHLFFRLQAKEEIDIVLTTSERTAGGGGIEYVRPTTSVGNLKGSTEIARAIGDLPGKRSVRVHLSEEIDESLSGDLVLLGGPNKNRISAICLEYIYQFYPQAKLLYIDSKEQGSYLGLEDFIQHYEIEKQEESQIPKKDFALIGMWINPLSPRKRRLIICAGFTGYGTAAAARYLVDNVMNDRYSKLRRRHHLPFLWHPRRWCCFLLALEITLANAQVIEMKERAFVPLADPGVPPLELLSVEVDGQIGSVPTRPAEPGPAATALR